MDPCSGAIIMVSAAMTALKNVIVEGGLWNGNTDQWPNTADFSNIRFAHCRNILLKDMHVKK